MDVLCSLLAMSKERPAYLASEGSALVYRSGVAGLSQAVPAGA